MKLRSFLFTGLVLIPALCFAHGPSRQKVIKEIEIDASPEKVWSLIADYCAIKEWDPAITDCESDNGTQPDSIRTITLENGEKVKEKLIKHLPDQMKYQYMMIEPNTRALPINTHGSSITVRANDKGGTTVEWKGAFYRAFPGPNPPPELSDEAGHEKVGALYERGLKRLKELAESK
jgi:hypothetical protein